MQLSIKAAAMDLERQERTRSTLVPIDLEPCGAPRVAKPSWDSVFLERRNSNASSRLPNRAPAHYNATTHGYQPERTSIPKQVSVAVPVMRERITVPPFCPPPPMRQAMDRIIAYSERPRKVARTANQPPRVEQVNESSNGTMTLTGRIEDDLKWL